ncbi:rapid alkalinization factor-like [Phalaenopsis equestris]|uniref:rapid alkalinization factor-like n=1 Tax=Phalaenopsis equestris TaxID=78828 RepID=UPI0009E3D4DA|nr:rapid alkalinization factor-like [Phalaenopsis equestris]
MKISAAMILLIALMAPLLCSPTAAGGEIPLVGWIPGGSACSGTIGECLDSNEFELASESSRRILATLNYISYNALRRGSIPCSRRGASYYNCRPGAQANPYSRGCSRITQCRS